LFWSFALNDYSAMQIKETQNSTEAYTATLVKLFRYFTSKHTGAKLWIN